MHLPPLRPLMHCIFLTLLLSSALFSTIACATDFSGAEATSTLSPAADGAKSPAKRQDGKIIPTGIVADTPQTYNGVPGTTVYYSFRVAPTATGQSQQRSSPHDMLKKREDSVDADDFSNQLDMLDDVDGALEKRQTGSTVYVSINTCQNPDFNRDEDRRNPPQMSILISTLDAEQELGSSLPNPQTIALDQGFAMRPVSGSEGAVVIGVVPPNVDIDKDSSAFVYNLAVSLNGPYHDVKNDVSLSLKLVDSDPSAALLTTENLAGWSANQTNKTFGSLEHGPPLNVFANNINYTRLNGLQNSYCAISQAGQVKGSAQADLKNGVEMGIIHAKPGNDLEQQIYLPGLNATSTYLGRLATLNASQYGLAGVTNGGGTLYPIMNFTTKTDPNCAVLFNLSFCADVNYAVPANPLRYDRAKLSALYDNRTAELFKNFTFSLNQISCNTTPTSQYSLAVDCNDCTAAYKTWLCAVSVPKCADFAEHYDPRSPFAGVAGNQGNFLFPEIKLPDHGDGGGGGVVPTPGLNDWSWTMPRNLAQAPLALPGTHAQLMAGTNESQLSWVATNSSRNNDTIAGEVQPGPYLEILPCEDLCYDLVRMCPAKLQFSCPKPNSLLMRVSYGQRSVAAGSGAYTCNAPGAVYFKNSAVARSGAWAIWSTMAVAAGMVLMTL